MSALCILGQTSMMCYCLRGFSSQGYAMVEYASAKEAQDAIDAMHGQEFMTQPLHVTWCFVKGPSRKRGAGAGGGARR